MILTWQEDVIPTAPSSWRDVRHLNPTFLVFPSFKNCCLSFGARTSSKHPFWSKLTIHYSLSSKQHFRFCPAACNSQVGRYLFALFFFKSILVPLAADDIPEAEPGSPSIVNAAAAAFAAVRSTSSHTNSPTRRGWNWWNFWNHFIFGDDVLENIAHVY